MAHFAEIDANNNVTRVVVISNADIQDEQGIEQEHLGVALCQVLIAPGHWVQTSYNNNFRKIFGQPGIKYTPDKDVFYNPVGPYPSWVLDENYDWVAPVPRPEEPCLWDESLLSWVLINDLPT